MSPGSVRVVVAVAAVLSTPGIGSPRVVSKIPGAGLGPDLFWGGKQ
jgi:hypothetical protein